jgi:hypothetical protein
MPVSEQGGQASNPGQFMWACDGPCSTGIDFFSSMLYTRGSGSSVGITTCYGLDGPGIKSR